MKTYKVTMEIRAECQSDAEELINDYTGQETDVTIKEVELIEDDDNLDFNFIGSCIKCGCKGKDCYCGVEE